MEPANKSQAPVMDVKAPPQQALATPPPETDKPPQPAEPGDKKVQTMPKQASAKQPGQSSNGVALAIVATVIIVLGLGLLATYAYLKQVR